MTPENKELPKWKIETLPSIFNFKEKLTSLKTETFLSLPEEKRMTYVTKPVMRNVDDIKKNKNEININFTFLNWFNKELRADISAWQILPNSVWSVECNGRKYDRTWLKWEFFTADWIRLVIHQGTKLENIQLRKDEIKKLQKDNDDLLKTYLKTNLWHTDLKDLVSASIDEWMNPYLAVFIFGDKLRKANFNPIARKVEIEKFLKDFSKIKWGLDNNWGVEWKNWDQIINKSYSSDLIAPFMKQYIWEGYVKKVKEYYKKIDNKDIDEKIIVEKWSSRKPKFLKQKQIQEIINKAPADLVASVNKHFWKERENALVVAFNESSFNWQAKNRNNNWSIDKW